MLPLLPTGETQAEEYHLDSVKSCDSLLWYGSTEPRGQSTSEEEKYLEQEKSYVSS